MAAARQPGGQVHERRVDGTVRRNHALAGETESADLSSTSLGLSATANWGTVEVYAARKLSGEAYDADKSRNTVWVNGLFRF